MRWLSHFSPLAPRPCSISSPASAPSRPPRQPSSLLQPPARSIRLFLARRAERSIRGWTVNFPSRDSNQSYRPVSGSFLSPLALRPFRLGLTRSIWPPTETRKKSHLALSLSSFPALPSSSPPSSEESRLVLLHPPPPPRSQPRLDTSTAQWCRDDDAFLRFRLTNEIGERTLELPVETKPNAKSLS